MNRLSCRIAQQLAQWPPPHSEPSIRRRRQLPPVMQPCCTNSHTRMECAARAQSLVRGEFRISGAPDSRSS
eukprot:6189637-Pleurochrysis_carterae.AAC.2